MRTVALLAVIAVVCGAVNEARATTLRLLGTNTEGSDSVVVRIELENEVPVFAFQVTIVDDPDVLDFESISATDRTTAAIVDANQPGGVVIVVVVSLDINGIAPGTGPIAEVRYSVRPGSTAGAVLLEPTGVSVAGAMGLPLETQTESGNVTIEAVPSPVPSSTQTPESVATPSNTPTPASFATPSNTPTDPATPTASPVEFDPTPTPPPIPTSTLEPTVNPEATVTLAPSATAQVTPSPTGTAVPRPTPMFRADVNCDGRISAPDALAVSRGRAGDILPCAADPTCDGQLGSEALAVVVDSLFLELSLGPCNRNL